MNRGNRNNNKFNVSGSGYKKLSEHRRDSIKTRFNTEEINDLNKNGTASIAHSKGFLKGAAVTTSIPTTTSQSDTLGPEIYSPLFQLANLNLPRDRVTTNAWNRIFYDTHPIVRNAINLHASYPISKISISCKDKKVESFFLQMSERIDLYSVIYGAALEFWKLGECFPYAELDASTGTWKRITILNPDYIHVSKASIGDSTTISLRPDAGLKKMVESASPMDRALRSKLPPHIIEHVRKGENIPLDNFNIAHLKLLSSPYDIRGTSIIVSVFKDLMLYDKLRECKFAQADGMVNPLTLVKLGGSEGYRPTQSDLDAFRSILEEAQYDKDFKLVTHDGVTIERVGFSGATLDVGTDIELINSNLYIGLMAPKSLMDQEGATYASSSIGLEILRQRYDIFRNMLKKWLEQKIFAPICELQGFFEYKDGEKVLLVPSVDFNHMNLYDMNDFTTSISTLVSDNKVSKHTLYRALNLDYEEEKNRLRQEAIDAAILAKETEALNSMRLAELRVLNPDTVINEEIVADAGGDTLPGMGGDELGGMEGLEDMGVGDDMGGDPESDMMGLV